MKTCCICGKEIRGYGNNPYGALDNNNILIEWAENSICCDECNILKVLPGRIYSINKNNKEKNNAEREYTNYTLYRIDKDCNYEGKNFKDVSEQINLNDYKKVFKKPIRKNKNIDEALYEIAIRLYGMRNYFNNGSLYVSDIIELDNNYYYCDDEGFYKLDFDKINKTEKIKINEI